MLKRRTTVQDNLMAPRKHPADYRRRRRPISPAVVARGTGLLLLLLLAAWFGLPFLLRAGRFRPVLESVFRGTLGRPASIREVRYSLRSGGLVASDLSIDEDPAFGAQPFLLARTVTFQTGVLPLLFSSEPEIAGITFDDAQVSLKQDRDGNWNFYGMLAAADRAPSGVRPARVRLTHGLVRVAGPRDDRKPMIFRDVDCNFTNPSLNRTSRLSLSAAFEGGGSLNLDGTAGPLGWNRGSPAIPASLLVNVKGVNLEESRLFEEAPGVAGVLSFDASVESDGGTVQVSGEGRVDKVRLSRNGAAGQPVRAAFSLRHDPSAHTGSLSRFDLRVAAGFAGVTGSYLFPPAGPLELHFQATANAASVTDLAALVPAAGYRFPAGSGLLGGLLFAELKIDGPADHPVVAGTVSINNTHVNGFELADKLAGIDALNVHDLGRDVDLTLWSASVRLSADGGTFEEVRAAISGFGEMAGRGAIGSNGALDFRMTGMRPGSAPVPFTVRGTSSDPVFRPGLQ